MSTIVARYIGITLVMTILGCQGPGAEYAEISDFVKTLDGAMSSESELTRLLSPDYTFIGGDGKTYSRSDVLAGATERARANTTQTSSVESVDYIQGGRIKVRIKSVITTREKSPVDPNSWVWMRGTSKTTLTVVKTSSGFSITSEVADPGPLILDPITKP